MFKERILWMVRLENRGLSQLINVNLDEEIEPPPGQKPAGAVTVVTMSDNTRYPSGNQEAQMPRRGVEDANALELYTMADAAETIESQSVALEKMQHDTSRNLRIPRLTKQTCGENEQPRAEEGDI